MAKARKKVPATAGKALVPAGKALARYAVARKALTAAKNVDEVKKIRNEAEAIRAYAWQAKDRSLELDAAEIRIRAERRLGQMIAVEKKTGRLSKGAAEKGIGRRGKKRGSAANPRITLEEAGIDKRLAHEARTLALPTDATFEELIAEWRATTEASNGPATVNLIRGARNPKQTSAFENSKSVLSSSGRKLERVIEKDGYAPEWLKLNETSNEMITTIVDTIRKLEKLAARISSPGAVEKFQAQFATMETRVTALAEQYWGLQRFMGTVSPDDSSAAEPLEFPPDDPEDSTLKKSGGGRDVPF